MVYELKNYIVRDGKKYKILEHNIDTGELQVEAEMNFATPPYKRRLKLWWRLKDCKYGE